MQEMMQIKAPRRWKFEAYTKEHRAVKTLTTDLLGGLRPYNTIIVSYGETGIWPQWKRTRTCSKQEVTVPLVQTSSFCHWIEKGLVYDQRMSPRTSSKAFACDTNNSLRHDAVQCLQYCAESRQERCARDCRHLLGNENLCGFTRVDNN